MAGTAPKRLRRAEDEKEDSLQVNASRGDASRDKSNLAVPVLVSFCNVKNSSAPRLALFQPADNRLFPLEFTGIPRHHTGITGLAANEKYIYAATQRATSKGREHQFLLIFSRRDFSLLSIYAFRRARDVHSLCWHQGRLLVISSGTDEIIKLVLKNKKVVSESAYWRLERDKHLPHNHHLNGICSSPDGLIICGFGTRKEAIWSSATNGFLMNVDRKERLLSGLEQPHSVTVVDSALVFCESRKSLVRSWKDDSQQTLPGYARGICSSGSFLFVGTSVGRRASRSTGQQIENPSDSGEMRGQCTINRLDPRTLALLGTTEVGPYAEEIYDLLPAEDIGRWPITEWR